MNIKNDFIPETGEEKTRYFDQGLGMRAQGNCKVCGHNRGTKAHRDARPSCASINKQRTMGK